MLKSINIIRSSRSRLFLPICQRFQHSEAALKENPTTSIEIKAENLTEEVKQPIQKSFAQMFKESKFVALGDLENKYLIGRIVDVIGDDVYVDYGGKFNCVVKRPEKGANYYVRNRNVKIKLVSFEMASYFLNAAKHITLLESDAELIGLVRSEKEEDERSKILRKEIDELNSEPYY
ncbi:unnamed protein product [Brachionus calyciflorus]|uniref:Mitochondrial ribosomal protein S28 n=1 Tax=Brachionus calyciflorus TaxID=104777 RepID=A0A813QPK7_9BILA|nr:unnamed protein product [Brachionus calyciflorus]